jgi:hypothetical protein
MNTLSKVIYRASHTKVNGFSCRTVEIRGSKYLVLHDLIAAFGRKFVNFLLIPPIVARVSDGSNSQDRRLVTITQFRNARNLQMESKDKKIAARASRNTAKPGRVEAEQHLFPFETLGDLRAKETKKVEPKEFDLSKITIDPSSVRKPGQDAPKEAKPAPSPEQVLRTRINSLVDNFAIVTALEENRTDDVEFGRIKGRMYTAMYEEFDRQIASALETSGKQLSDYGLGLEARINLAQKAKKGCNYMAVIEKLGCLPQLLVVAKQMFESQTK